MGGREDDEIAVIGVAFYLDQFASGICAVPMPSFCVDRHEHLGALAWVDGGGAGAVFLRCDRRWFGWRSTAEAAVQIDWARQSGASPTKLMELTLLEPGNASFWRMFRGAKNNQAERDGRRLAKALRDWGAGPAGLDPATS